MSEAALLDRPEANVTEAEHVDVLIVGAGLSGVSAGYHLQHSMPGTSFMMLEAQKSYGGTWYTHKYPGIRSDSDLYTFGFRFKPWTGPPIATAEEIRRYMGEAIAENGLERRIRYQHKVLKASWSSETKRWSIEGIRTDTGETVRFTANFLWMCQGYYRHEDGFTPDWKGTEDFEGEIVHSMHWKEGTDLTGTQVVVIERFVPDGIELQSGEVLKADVVVAATGFHLSVLGDIEFTIDGVPLAFGETVTYRGMMFTGVPNLVWVFGYLRASWTLRADLVADFIVRLLGHMKAQGVEMVVPALRPEDADMALEPWIAPDNFNPGYVNRGIHLLPKCGSKTEWRHTHDYWEDNHTIPAADLDDGNLVYR